MSSKKMTHRQSSLASLWFERFMALLALSNLLLVLFDLSYVPWRDFYLKIYWTLGRFYEPIQDTGFFEFYDPYKGIEPHRDTQRYLDTVKTLKTQVAENGINSPQVVPVLQELQELSATMIDENPFQIANKTGTLEKIKNRMREHIGNESSKESFNTFWSQEYLNQAGWNNQITFFERRIQPLIALNYYRSIGENGEFIDRFWKIDRWFMAIFFGEFIARTWIISRRHPGLRWVPDAMSSRWYDIFLLFPFWRWLRVIPVAIRLNRAKFPNLEPVRAQFSRVFVASFAEELTEVVVIQIINQTQEAINNGDIAKSLLKSSNQPYIDLNQTNELETIAKRLLNVTICKALPEIQTDLQALLQHNLEKTLVQLPLYQQLQHLPGMKTFPQQLSERLASQLSKVAIETPQNTYAAIANAPPDPVGTQLTDRLVEHFSQALRTELQQQQTITELESLLSDFLEEIKINYVKRPTEQDHEEMIQQTQQLRRLAGR